jgi:HlyD family secretion protein
MNWRICAVLALVAVLAGCNEAKNPGYQGWVEADMIFVSPDESGRVTKLDVREGDEVKPGMPLYSVDDDLQKADLNQQNATLANAQQTYDRAASLSRTGSGTQANFDAAVSALRVAEARVNTAQTRLARRHGFADFEAYVAKIGRSQQIELCFVVPAAFPIGDIRTLDAIRDEVGHAIGGEGPDRWLTIIFTGDQEWAR